MNEWRFPHPDTGQPCVATYDNGLLTVEIDPHGNAGDPDEKCGEDNPSDTAWCLYQSGVERTHCATIEAARRELRAIGVESSVLA